MGKWKTTDIPGLRYRLHPNRRLRNGQPDRYYSLRIMVQGKRREEGLGFSSEGWTVARAAQISGQIRANIRAGSGPQSLAEMREHAQAERQAMIIKVLDQKRAAMTFADLVNRYIAWARDHKPTWKNDQTYMRLHSIPVIGHLPLNQITRDHIEQIKDRTRDMGRADGTIKHALAITRLVFNWAARTPWSTQDPRPIFEGKNPTQGVKLPNPDYHRLRFLTPDEARKILDLAKTGNQDLPPDQDLHDIILLGLYTGLRRGAITALQ
ncbi:MAG: site-specific integrase, partial [Thermodesulfobacteriota bacterium]|nr:site-specific integrase [Thermodesulfobacteriota bacterium]